MASSAHNLLELEKDPRLFLYTSLTSGSSHIVTATSRMELILKANKLPFLAIDIATDEKARRLWQRRGAKKKLPGLVKEGYVIGDIDDVEEWNEFGELKENVGPVPASNAAPSASARQGLNIGATMRGTEGLDAPSGSLLGAVSTKSAQPKGIALPGMAEVAAMKKAKVEAKAAEAKKEPVKEEAAKAEPAEEEAAKVKPAEEEGKAQPTKEGTAETESPKEEATKAEPTKEDAVKQETTEEEATEAGTTNEEAAKAEPPKEEAVKVEPAEEEAVKTEPTKEEAVKAEPTKEEAVKQEATKDDAVKSTTTPAKTVNAEEATKSTENVKDHPSLDNLSAPTQSTTATTASREVPARTSMTSPVEEDAVKSLESTESRTAEALIDGPGIHKPDHDSVLKSAEEVKETARAETMEREAKTAADTGPSKESDEAEVSKGVNEVKLHDDEEDGAEKTPSQPAKSAPDASTSVED